MGRDDTRGSAYTVLCAGTNWDATQLSEQHLARELSRHTRVLYVDPPLSPLSARKDPRLAACLDEDSLRLLTPSLARLTPRGLPAERRTGLRQLTTAALRWQLRRASRALGGPPDNVIVVSDRPVLGHLGEHRSICWAKDDYVAGAHLIGDSPARRMAGDRRVAGTADLVVAASPVLAERWRALGARVVMIPNGVDAAAFRATDRAPRVDGLRLSSPVAGFVGTLSARIDWTLLEALVRRGMTLLLVGGIQKTLDRRRIETLLAHDNTTWVGAQPFERLPSYLRMMDVAVVPYADTPFNRASFPLKLLEYLAAGRPVVSTDLPAVRWLDTDLITVTDPGRWADTVLAAATRPSSPGQRSARRRFAEDHSWPTRTAQWIDVLGIEHAGDHAAPAGAAV